MTAKNIVENWLKEHGHDGLCTDNCGCAVGDLMPCGSFGDLCVPAQRVKATAEHLKYCDGELGDDIFIPSNAEVTDSNQAEIKRREGEPWN